MLETAKAPSGDGQVQLLGFRAGGTLCLRIVVIRKTRASRQSCAPLAELRHAGAPVRVVIVDDGFGQGPKRAWYGIDRVGAPAVQITAGITADGVNAVTLHDNAGAHRSRSFERLSLRRLEPRHRPARRRHLRPHRPGTS